MIKLLGISILISCASLEANVRNAWDSLARSGGSVRNYPKVIRNLVSSGLYFTAVPYVKEYLVKAKSIQSKALDQSIDRIISEVGVRQFEALPLSILNKSKAPTIRYILAKKLFRQGKYQKSLKALNAAIPKNHPVRPFALLLEASVFSILKKYDSAINSFRNCMGVSESAQRGESRPDVLRQLRTTREYCLAGIPRTYFAAGKFEKAHSAYLDIPKDSFVWPEILFEEAWNSFYRKEYNRALGKLVTYKAPIFKFIFNPEIEVLRALTFLELCMWEDVNEVVNQFYTDYQKDSLAVKEFIQGNGKNYKYYYLLMKTYKAGKKTGNPLFNRVLDNLGKDPTYIELSENFDYGKRELDAVLRISNPRAKKVFENNLKTTLLMQRDLIGAYVRSGLVLKMATLDKAFKGISYIKLEILSRRKRSLYNLPQKKLRTRGDIRNVEITPKQYFWTFNGEFWADELGDYVFSLKTACQL